jgi:hypothetical protein
MPTGRKGRPETRARRAPRSGWKPSTGGAAAWTDASSLGHLAGIGRPACPPRSLDSHSLTHQHFSLAVGGAPHDAVHTGDSRTSQPPTVHRRSSASGLRNWRGVHATLLTRSTRPMVRLQEAPVRVHGVSSAGQHQLYCILAPVPWDSSERRVASRRPPARGSSRWCRTPRRRTIDSQSLTMREPRRTIAAE